MSRRGPQKHSLTKIAGAIMKHEAGTPISRIAEEEDVSKSLVKYWIDHAEKFLPASVQAKRAPALAKLFKRGELLGWKKFVQLLSIPKKAIDEMDPLKRVEALDKLEAILRRIAGRAGSGTGDVPQEVVEVSAERSSKLIVRNWSQKAAEDRQGAPQAERSPKAEVGAPPIDAAVVKPEGNSGT